MSHRPSRLLLAALIFLGVSLTLGCGGGGTAAPAPVTVSVFPPAATVLVSETVQFVASGGGSSYTWSVNGTTGGNATVGTIDSNGLYAAPSVAPSTGSVTVTATSAATPSASASAKVSVANPLPAVTSVSPSTILAGSGDTTITVSGSQFQPSS